MIRKRFLQLMGICLFLGTIWAIREYGIFEFLENLFRDPMGQVPSIDVER